MTLSVAGVGGGGYRPSPSDLFSKLDTDGDGKVTKTEFVAGRPENADEAGSEALYDKLTSAATSSDTSAGLSQSDFASAFQQIRPEGQGALIQAQAGRDGPPPPPPGGGQGPGGPGGTEGAQSADSEEDSDTQLVQKIAQSLDELLKELQAANGEDTSDEETDDTTDSKSLVASLSAQLEKFLMAHESYNRSATQASSEVSIAA